MALYNDDFILKVGIDLDSVINDLTNAWRSELNKMSKFNLTTEDIKEWDWECSYPDLTTEQIYSVTLNPKFWEEMPEIPNAVASINELLDNKHVDLYIITASYPKTVSYKSDWLTKHLPKFDQKKVITTYSKQIINVDLMVDDGLHNLKGGRYDGVVFDYPYNRKDLEHDVHFDSVNDSVMFNMKTRMFRCFGWSDVMDLIDWILKSIQSSPKEYIF